MSSDLKYFIELTPLQYDTILALVVEKYNLLQKLPLKRRKQLNILYGENYVNDYENCLYDLKHKMECLKYE